MRDRDVAPRPTPVLPESCFEALLQAVKANLGRLLATWDALTAAARRYASDERKQGRGLLAYLFANLTEVPVRESKFIEGFLLAMTDSASKWQVADRVLLLSDFEELLLSVARTELPAEDQEPVYHFVHALSAKLVRAVLEAGPGARTNLPSTTKSLEQLLTFDAHLFAARDAFDVFQSLVADSCDLAGFHRSALFVYNPLTKTVEGLFAHQVELDAVRRIRESERRIPLLYEVTRLHKPVFLDDVSPFLPPQYVRHFQLTSLLVCPVRGPADQSIGVLLVDEGGRRFPHSPAQSELLYRMLNRVSLSLASHLQVGRLPAHTAPCILTERELDVLHLIADGLHTKSAAERLHISEHTVTEHVTSILRKLGVTNRAAAVAKALREGFIR